MNKEMQRQSDRCFFISAEPQNTPLNMPHLLPGIYTPQKIFYHKWDITRSNEVKRPPMYEFNIARLHLSKQNRETINVIKAVNVKMIGALIVFSLITALIVFVSAKEPVQENSGTVDEALSEKFTQTFRSNFASNDGIALFDRVEIVPNQHVAKIYSTIASTDDDAMRQLAVNKLGSMVVNHYYYYAEYRAFADLNDVRVYGSDGKDLGYTFSDSLLSTDQ